MSREVEQFTLENRTKKEKVIYLAKRDPFLKVEKIAKLVETSSHYVRTVLSEANLSLTKLRKEYAHGKKKTKKSNKALKDLLDIEQLNNLSLSKKLDKPLLNNDYKEIKAKGASYFGKTELFRINSELNLLNSKLVVTETLLNNSFQLQAKNDIEYSQPKFSISNAKKEIADVLDITSNASLLTLEKEIYINQELRGIDVVYCNSNKLQLEVEQKSNQTIKLMTNS